MGYREEGMMIYETRTPEKKIGPPTQRVGSDDDRDDQARDSVYMH